MSFWRFLAPHPALSNHPLLSLEEIRHRFALPHSEDPIQRCTAPSLVLCKLAATQYSRIDPRSQASQGGVPSPVILAVPWLSILTSSPGLEAWVCQGKGGTDLWVWERTVAVVYPQFWAMLTDPQLSDIRCLKTQ